MATKKASAPKRPKPSAEPSTAKSAPTDGVDDAGETPSGKGGEVEPSAMEGMANREKLDTTPKKAPRGAAKEALRLVEGDDSESIAQQVDALLGDARTAATQAARILGEVAAQKPAALGTYVDRFIVGLSSDNPRVIQACADILPALATVAPARVAKHLDKLRSGFASLPEAGKDGVVRTFANLCSASVAYQKRLEPVLKVALAGCDGKTLVAWTNIVLPALKGEPHANARAVVEKRLPDLSKAHAQSIADFLGIKLRVRR